jgi:hypothetical protein
MSRNTKIILGLLVGILGVCLCGAVVAMFAVRRIGSVMAGRTVVTDPAEVARIAEGMAEYDLPSGYREEFVIDFLLIRLLFIAPTRSSAGDQLLPIFTLGQPSSVNVLAETDLEEFSRQFLATMERESRIHGYDLQYVGEVETVIAGQRATLTVHEGLDDEGNQVRQVISSWFEVRGRPTVLMIKGDIETWDQTDVDAFVESIR